MRLATLALLAALPAATSASGQSPGSEPQIDIALSNFRFEPSTITLQHAHAYTLHFVNRASGGHDFIAKAFFAAAAVAPSDRGKIAKGGVALKGGDQADVHIVAPAAGRYDAHCSHFMHSTFGMTAMIVVQ